MTEYFRFAKIKYPIGHVFTGTGVPHVEPEVEKKIEASRPDGKISRDNATYLVEEPDFTQLGLSGCGYIHIVKPLEGVQTHDTFWLGQLQAKNNLAKVLANPNKANLDEKIATALVKVQITDDEICQKYWSGASSAEFWSGEPTWEVLTSRAEVIGHLSPEVVCVRDTKGGWRDRSKK